MGKERGQFIFCDRMTYSGSRNRGKKEGRLEITREKEKNNEPITERPSGYLKRPGTPKVKILSIRQIVTVDGIHDTYKSRLFFFIRSFILKFL